MDGLCGLGSRDFNVCGFELRGLLVYLSVVFVSRVLAEGGELFVEGVCDVFVLVESAIVEVDSDVL